MSARSLESLREARPRANARSEPTLVWDLFVRIFHWSLVTAVSVALVTGLVLPRNWIALHLAGGTLAIALVAARVVWGFLGPSYARFSAFVRAPREVLHHLRESAGGQPRRHRGHNPLGGLMIVGLMATVTALAVTGTVALGGGLKSGPLAFITTNAVGEAFGEMHEVLADILLVLIGLHVAGAIFESLRSRENLVAAMVDGRKEARSGDVVPPFAQARPARAAAIVVVLLAAWAGGIVLLSGRPGLGVPRGALDPAYASACGDCHVAYHPSLLPAPTWDAMFDGLARHFGENATLEEDEARQVRAYVLANSAEAFDTRAANRLRQTDPSEPLKITATRFWRRVHAGIDDATFAAKPIGGRGNCNACHADAAAGAFHPSQIRIPEGGAK